MTEIGDRVVTLPTASGKPVTVALFTPEVGDKVVTIPDASGKLVTVSLAAPEVGDQVVLVPDASGKMIAVSIAPSEMPPVSPVEQTQIVRWNPAGTLLAVSHSQGCSIYRVTGTRARKLFILPGTEGYPSRVCEWSPDGKCLAVGLNYRWMANPSPTTLCVYAVVGEVFTPLIISDYFVPPDPPIPHLPNVFCSGLAWSPTSDCLVTNSWYPGDSGHIGSTEFHFYLRDYFTIDIENEINQYVMQYYGSLHEYSGANYPWGVDHLQFTPDGNFLFKYSETTGNIDVYRAWYGETEGHRFYLNSLYRTQVFGGGGTIYSFNFSPDSQWVFFSPPGGVGATLYKFNAALGYYGLWVYNETSPASVIPAEIRGVNLAASHLLQRGDNTYLVVDIPDPGGRNRAVYSVDLSGAHAVFSEADDRIVISDPAYSIRWSPLTWKYAVGFGNTSTIQPIVVTTFSGNW